MSSCPDCIFEIHQLWQSGFSRVYSNCCCNCSFEPEIIKIGQQSHKMYSNNIVNFQDSTTILNACTKKSGNLLKAPHMSVCMCVVCIFVYVWVSVCMGNLIVEGSEGHDYQDQKQKFYWAGQFARFTDHKWTCEVVKWSPRDQNLPPRSSE